MKHILVDLGGTLILNHDGNAVLNQSLFAILEKLKDRMRLLVISDTEYDVTAMLENFGITEAFHPLVITKHLFPIDKYKADTYLFACGKAEAQPADCLLIDNEEGFVVAAKTAGLETASPHDPLLESIIGDFLS